VVDLFSRRLRCAWEFTPGLPIWRLHPPVNGRIIGEVRNTETKRATFFALSTRTGTCLWRERELHDPWWVAIDRVAGDKLVLHGYQSPDFPVRRGVTVVDIPSGTVVWSDPGWTGDEEVLAGAGGVPSVAVAEEAAFPVALDPHTPDPAASAVLAQWPIDRIVGPMEIAEYAGRKVVAAHLGTGQSGDAPLVHLLRVYDMQTWKILYEDTLMGAAKGIAPDAFFTHAGILYYIRERTTLCAVKL
jgi:hypothetical protein